jgi:hypothetical protein
MRKFLKPRTNFASPLSLGLRLTKNFATIDQSSFVIEYDEELYSTRHAESFAKFYPNASTFDQMEKTPGHCNPRDSKYYKLKSLDGLSQSHESNFSSISPKGTPEDDQIFITSIGIGNYFYERLIGDFWKLQFRLFCFDRHSLNFSDPEKFQR